MSKTKRSLILHSNTPTETDNFERPISADIISQPIYQSGSTDNCNKKGGVFDSSIPNNPSFKYCSVIRISHPFLIPIIFIHLGSVASVRAWRASHHRQPGEKEDHAKKTSHSRPPLRGTPHWTGTQVSSAALWPVSSTN